MAGSQEANRWVLSGYHPPRYGGCKQIQKMLTAPDLNRIDQFHRMPQDLWRYLKYCHKLKQQYGSVLYYIQYERLNWSSIEPSGSAPFINSADYKILYNDWPYSLDRDIVHVVVWTKFVLTEDSRTGKLTQDTKSAIEAFVVDTFCTRHSNESVIPRSNLRWFKNPSYLRSVHALGKSDKEQ